MPWGNCDLDKVLIIVNNGTQGDIIADSEIEIQAEDDCVDDIHIIYEKSERVRKNISSLIRGDQNIFPGVPPLGLSRTQARLYLPYQGGGTKLAR